MTTIPSFARTPPLLRLAYITFRKLAERFLDNASESFKRRWVGSDVLERYTAYYTWITNQIGHFTVGVFAFGAAWFLAYVVPYFVAWLLKIAFAAPNTAQWLHHRGDEAHIWSMVLAALFWVLYVVKEVADIVQEDRLVRIGPDKHRPFPINGALDREIALDGWTDAFFVGFGILFTQLAAQVMAYVADKNPLTSTGEWLWLVATGAICLICVRYAYKRGQYYLPAKRRFDESDLPYYARLTRFSGRLVGALIEANGATLSPLPEGKVVARLQEVAAGQPCVPHVCVFGPPLSGKSRLAISIACELLGEDRAVRYVAAIDLARHQVRKANSPASEPARLTDERLVSIEKAGWIVVDHLSAANAPQALTAAGQLSSGKAKPVFIFTGDYEPDERLDVLREISRALAAPCLGVALLTAGMPSETGFDWPHGQRDPAVLTTSVDAPEVASAA